MFPLISRNFTEHGDSHMERMVTQVLKNTDQRIHNNMRVNPAFLFSAMLWYPLQERAQKLAQEGGWSTLMRFSLALNDILDERCRSLAIPKRLTTLMRDIWQLQLRLSRRQGKRAIKLMEHPKFRAGYDLLALRAEVENNAELQRLTQWWGEFQVAAPPHQKSLLGTLGEDSAAHPRPPPSPPPCPLSRSRIMTPVWLAIGSNLADPLHQVDAALVALSMIPATRLTACSSYYRSRPLGPQDQPDYLMRWRRSIPVWRPECCCSIPRPSNSNRAACAKPTVGDRAPLISIFCCSAICNWTPKRLTIPHYDMKNREFMLYPLAELAPDLVFPDGEKLADRLPRVPRNGLTYWDDRHRGQRF